MEVLQTAAPGDSPAAATATKITIFNRAANRLKPLGNGTRLQILDVLSRGEISVKELCVMIGQSRVSISHHLSLFRLGEIIECRRQGGLVICGLTDRGHSLSTMVKKIMDECA